MQRCRRVGIDVTKRCNWACQTCFYRWRNDFNTPYDKPLDTVMSEVTQGASQGSNHVVLVGWGEPGLWPHLIDMINRVKSMGMTSSIITNGSLPIELYEEMREAGLNHLHISVHGLGDTLDNVVCRPGAGQKQAKLFEWLKSVEWPWRMNMTVQRVNYQELNNIATTCLQHGCRHIVSLGFLPHYEWNDPMKLREVAVHPAELQPYIQQVADTVENWNEYGKHGFKSMFTIRYHPMCHLDEKYRRFVVNARYVLYDPWEWSNYGYATATPEQLWASAVSMGESVAVNTEPCIGCGLRMHCGGWNRVYANGFAGAALRAVFMPSDTQVPGYLHDQNPANHERGYF